MAGDQLDLLALCALREGKDGLDWSLIAREALRVGDVGPMLEGRIGEHSGAAERSLAVLERAIEHIDGARARVNDELGHADRVGARLVTVLDAGYPANLKLVRNLPPFLFVLGDDVTDADLRSVAVVGTRNPSERGIELAQRMAAQLVENGVTVVSGLAAGIDTTAHRAALGAGGRTIAVIGTGITRTYPSENDELAAEIARHGAVVSQFWPTTPPARWTFPRRNAVMSGIAQGTVVIEAKHTSGAKMQARLALEHGKQAFLLRSLVTDQPWAKDYVRRRGAIEVGRVEDVIAHLAAPERIRTVTDERERQLTLDLV